MKLKDREGRGGIRIPLKQAFGFIPDEIIIQKIQGQNNRFVVSAVLTDAFLAEMKKAEAAKKDETGQKGKGVVGSKDNPIIVNAKVGKLPGGGK